MQRMFLSYFFFVCAQLVFLPLSSSFAAPDVVFRIQTEGTGNPFPTTTTAPAAWEEISLGTNSYSRWAGSASGNSLTVEGEFEITGPNATRRKANTEKVYAYVKAPNSSKITITANGVVSLAGSINSGYPIGAHFGVVPFSGPFEYAQISVTGTGGYQTASDSLNQTEARYRTPACSGASQTYLPEYPGVPYYRYDLSPLMTSSLSVGVSFSGQIFAGGSLTYDVEVLNEDPVLIFESDISFTPELNDIATLSSGASFDPDDTDIEVAGAGICSTAWTITRPDNTVFNSSLKNPTFQFTYLGTYNGQVTVTDNEGTTATETFQFVVDGPVRDKRRPGDECRGPLERVVCSEGKGGSSIEVCSDTGNIHLSISDPVPTRGFPLSNYLFYNSQSEESSALGNFSFTYGMRVLKRMRDDGNGGMEERYIVLDGDGAEHDFGPTSSAPSASNGVFSTLEIQLDDTYKLSNAAQPHSVEEYGNFQYIFDENGVLLEIEDPQGNIQELQYNGSGELTEVLDLSTGKNIQFQYDSPGLIARIVENQSASITHLTYDLSDRVIAVELTDALLASLRLSEFTYNGDGLLATITPDGDSSATVTLSYSTSDLGAFRGNWTSSKGESNYTYSTALLPSDTPFVTVRQNASGGTETYAYGADGYLAKITLPAPYGSSTQIVHSFVHNTDGKATSYSIGSVSAPVLSYTMDYNAHGFLTRVENNIGQFREYDYDGANLTEVSDNIGLLYELEYTDTNQPNVPTVFKRADGLAWNRTLNSYGQVTSVSPPSGSPTGSTTFIYDETALSPNLGLLLSVTNGAGETTTFDSYTALGQPTSVTTEPLPSTFITTLYEYDAAQRLTKMTHANGKYTEYNYTGRNLTSTEDESGTTVSYSYCAVCGVLEGISEPLGRNHSFLFNDDKQLTTLTDARSYNTTYTYGASGELKKELFPDTKYYEYKYDSIGRVREKKLKVSAKTLTYSYDSAGRFSSETATDHEISRTYNADNTLATDLGWGNLRTYSYDTNRRVTGIEWDYWSSLSIPNSQNIEIDYNSDDTIAEIRWKNGVTLVASWEYEYDGAGRVVDVTNSLGETTEFTYDRHGNILTQENDNSTETEYLYNYNRELLTDIKHKQSGSTLFQHYELEYDSGANEVGNLTRVDELSGDYITYGYDALYRLTSEARVGSGSYSNTYGYDLTGNLTTQNGTSFGTYNQANVMMSYSGGAIYSEDDNWISSLRHPAQSLTSFQYYKVPMLSRIKRTGNSWWVDFRYDADSKLTAVDWHNAPWKVLVRLGDMVLGEVQGSTVKKIYTHGPAGIISQYDSATSSSHWYHFGPQGETRYLTDNTGVVSDSYAYDAWGVDLGRTGSTNNKFKYGGKYGYYDEGIDNGFIVAGVRVYLPKLRRWLTKDPIGYDGGYNLYEYVGSNPVNRVDPSGEAWIYNNSARSIPYKPETGQGRLPGGFELCTPGSWCNVDGVYSPDGNSETCRPVKVPGNCVGYITQLGNLAVACLLPYPRWLTPRTLSDSELESMEGWPKSFR